MKTTNKKPLLGEKARVIQTVYEDARRGMILKVTDIQQNYYAEGSHRYWASDDNGNNFYFNQKELELA